MHDDMLRWHIKHKDASWYRIPYLVEEFFSEAYTQAYTYLDIVSDRLLVAARYLDVYVDTIESIRKLYNARGLTYIRYILDMGQADWLYNVIKLIHKWSAEDGLDVELVHNADDDNISLYDVCPDLEELDMYGEHLNYEDGVEEDNEEDTW
jgi:hypothetical protein